jgi:hypothetical protein
MPSLLAFTRMNVAMLNATAGVGGKDPQERAVDWLEKIAANTANTERAVGDIQPAFAR